MLEAFGLVHIARIPAATGNSTASYGRIEIVREDIDEQIDKENSVAAERKALLRKFARTLGIDMDDIMATLLRGGAVHKESIAADETVRLTLSDEERELLKDPTVFFLDDDLDEEVQREREARDGLRFTLEQLDRFGGYIAAHANHAEDPEKEALLDGIYEKVCWLEDTYEEAE